MDVLKTMLSSLGLKCGGRATDRAARLWAVRGVARDKIPMTLRDKATFEKVSKAIKEKPPVPVAAPKSSKPLPPPAPEPTPAPSAPALAAPVAPAAPTFPYPVDEADHCETPLLAYSHIAPLLKACGGTVYDPYYCDGTVAQHLTSLGFSVSHEKADCYEVWRTKQTPSHGVFTTNPPYSEDHVERLMTHLCTDAEQKTKPFFLLMPQFFHKHEYYKKLTAGIRPFYLVPKKRYVYLPPASFREKKKSDTHKKSSPFVSMWYCWGGDVESNERLMMEWQKAGARDECDLAKSKAALRDLRRK